MRRGLREPQRQEGFHRPEKEARLVQSEQERDQEQVAVSSGREGWLGQGSGLRNGDPAPSRFAQSRGPGGQVDQSLNEVGSQ